jgi:hypothetical protein
MPGTYNIREKGATVRSPNPQVRTAVEAGIPIVALLVHEDHPWPPKLLERDGRLHRFRAALSRNRELWIPRISSTNGGGGERARGAHAPVYACRAVLGVGLIRSCGLLMMLLVWVYLTPWV